MTLARRLVSLSGCLAITGCAATSFDPSTMEVVKDVDAIEPMALEQICIEVNTEVKSELTDGLFKTIGELGIRTQSRQGAFGDECRFWLRYQATWGGFPEHLKTAQIDVLDNQSVIGNVRYDATQGASRPDRYGTAISKLAPLLEALFVRVKREGG